MSAPLSPHVPDSFADVRRPWCQHVTTALRWLLLLLVSASVSIAGAWLVTLCFSHGALVVSGVRPADQSAMAFLLATVAWAHVFFSMVAWISRSIALFPMELSDNMGRPAGARRILFIVGQRSLPWFIVIGATVIGLGELCGRMEAWRPYKPELYVSVLISYSYLVATEIIARRVYRYETIQGRMRIENQETHGLSVVNTLRVFSGKFVQAIALAVPMMHVHVISSFRFMSQTTVIWATLISYALKVAMQETAKFYVVRRRVHNPRTMAVLVCTPTVLIDTQLRIMSLRFQSAGMTASSTLVMATIELSVRVLKAQLLKRQIRRSAPQQRRTTLFLSSTTSVAPSADAGPKTDSVLERTWRAQLIRFSVIELSAEMFAEYLAIGCSGAIVFFFWNHPKYSLQSTTSTGTGVPAAMVALQIGVEVLVDYISCIVELSSGMDLSYFDRERGYFLVFFVGLAVVNVNASAILYLTH